MMSILEARLHLAYYECIKTRNIKHKLSQALLEAIIYFANHRDWRGTR